MMNMTHTRLLVEDLRESFLFYRDILGFPVTWGDEDGGYASFNVGGHTLALFGRSPMADAVDGPAPAPLPDNQDKVCLVFAVEDVDEIHRELIGKGITPLNEPEDRQDWGIRCFHFRDPAGILIEVNQDLPG